MKRLVPLLGLVLAAAAAAHDARPVSIALVEQTEGVYRAILRAPPTLEPGNLPRLVWPEGCEQGESAPLVREPGATSLVGCPGGLAGRALTVDYPLYNPSLTTLFRLETADGALLTAVLPPDTPSWQVPAEPTGLGVASDYTRLGFTHIWQGFDHLLFVLGLLLLARGPKRIVLAVTGFTAAHSITLSLAALGFVRVPVAPVEAMIALSILFLAAEIARRDPLSFGRRYPIALSFVFGLLHGFGFASALGEIGLPRGELAAGLLFFNIGVELGQLAFIAAVSVCVVSLRRIDVLRSSRARPAGHGAAASHSARLGLVGAYALGIPAAFWLLERTVLAFGL